MGAVTVSDPRPSRAYPRRIFPELARGTKNTAARGAKFLSGEGRPKSPAKQ